MKLIQVELPDQVASEMEVLVKTGWFADESELVRLALAEFVRHHRLDLQEQFQREDIAWALRHQQKDAQ